MSMYNNERAKRYVAEMAENACEDCRLKDDCDQGINFEIKGEVEIEDPEMIDDIEEVLNATFIIPEDGSLYLTSDEVEWLRCELDCLNMMMMSADKDLVQEAQEASRLSGALDYILATQVYKEDEE